MFAVLLILVTTGILAIGRLLPMARRDADWFGGASATLTAILAVSVCAFTGWLLLSRPITEAGIEDSFSFVLLSATIWVFAFLVPKAIRERDLFGFVCAIIAAVLALPAWLLIGIGVGSA